MNPVDLVAVLAIAQFLFFGVMVGRARARYKVNAPATSGHEMFDRAFRVHMNTLEQLVCFLPLLYISARYWSPAVVAAIGAVYLIGRFVYAAAYNRNPESRPLGFGLTILPVGTLLVMGLIGAITRA